MALSSPAPRLSALMLTATVFAGALTFLPAAQARAATNEIQVSGSSSQLLVVPANTHSIDFAIDGGEGGRQQYSSGGLGARHIGSIAVKPGDQVRFYGAERGRDGVNDRTTIPAGGAGYASGGRAGGRGGGVLSSSSGASGGGAAGITVNGVAVVVAAGGGGSGGWGSSQSCGNGDRGGNAGSDSFRSCNSADGSGKAGGNAPSDVGGNGHSGGAQGRGGGGGGGGGRPGGSGGYDQGAGQGGRGGGGGISWFGPTVTTYASDGPTPLGLRLQNTTGEGPGTVRARYTFVDVSAANSSMRITEGDRLADGAQSHTVTLQIRNAANQLTSEGSGLLHVAAPSDTTLGGLQQVGTGVYEAKLTSRVAGKKSISADFGGVNLTGSPASASFIAGPPAPENAGTSFTVSEGEASVDEGSHTVTAQLRDATGNPVLNSANGLKASADAIGSGKVSDFSPSASPGEYTATITSSVVGSKQVHVTYEGADLRAAGNDRAQFVAAAVAPDHSATSYTVSTGDQVVGTGEHSISVSLSDRFGNPVENAANRLEADAEETLGDGAISAFAHAGDGTYRATIASTVPGAKRVTVSADGLNILPAGNDIARFVPGAVDPTNSATSFTVSQGDAVVGTGQHTVTAVMSDSYGNPIPGAADELTATTTDELGKGGIGDFAETDTVGTYAATITSTVPGAKTISVAHGSAPVAGSGNDRALFIAGDVDSDHAKTTYTVSTGERIVGSGEHTITAALVDRYGNPVETAASQLRANATGGLGDGNISAFSHSGNGTYTATITSTMIGGKIVTVSHADQTLQLDGNGIALFTAGAVDPAQDGTTFTVSEGDAIVGTDRHTITAALTDSFGNPVTGAVDALAATTIEELGDGSIGGFVETSTAGTYTAKISSTVPGTKSIEVTHGDAALAAAGNDRARFVAGALDPDHAQTRFSVSTGKQPVGTGQHTITVELVDRYGNPIVTAADELSAVTEGDLGDGGISAFAHAPDAGGEAEAAPTVAPESSEPGDSGELEATSGPGVYTATVTSTVAGDHRIAVGLGDVVVTAAGNAIASFAHGSVDATHARTSFQVSEGDELVRTGEHAVTVLLADRYGNPVTGAEQTIVAETAHGIGDGAISAFTPTTVPGEYSASIRSTEEGRKVITVSVAGIDVPTDKNDTASFVEAVIVTGLALTGLATAVLPVTLGLSALFLGAFILFMRSRKRTREDPLPDPSGL